MRQTTGTPRTGWIPKLLTVGLLLVLSAPFISLFVAIFGMVTGEEFSPDTFQRRSFVYYQTPILRVQITPRVVEDTTSALERYLRRQQWLPPWTGSVPRWHVVQVTGAGIGRWLGDARILSNYLDQRQERDYRWLAWSKAHPDSARCLWSAMARVARQDLYVFAPELMHLAESSRDAVQLEQLLSAKLASQYVWLAQTQQRLGHHTQAVFHFSEALSYLPEDAAALRGRAQSYRRLGQVDQARADLKRLLQLGHPTES